MLFAYLTRPLALLNVKPSPVTLDNGYAQFFGKNLISLRTAQPVGVYHSIEQILVVLSGSAKLWVSKRSQRNVRRRMDPDIGAAVFAEIHIRPVAIASAEAINFFVMPDKY
jgi:hypothetical protein